MNDRVYAICALIVALAVFAACAALYGQSSTRPTVETTGGYHRVYVDGDQVSQHTTYREAIKTAINRGLADPEAEIVVRSDEVRVEVEPGENAEPSDDAPSPQPDQSAGWTQFEKSDDTRAIHVANDGDDSNSGLSANEPLRTVEAGIEMLRDEHPDWLLFKRGDTFNGRLGYWDLSGRSEDEPMVIGSYGDGPRPRFNANGKSFINVFGGVYVHDVAFVDLHFYANTRDPGSDDFEPPDSREVGVRWMIDSERVLFENLLVEYFTEGFSIKSDEGFGQRDTTIRRSIVRHCYQPGGDDFSQGIYAYRVDGLVLEENIFYHNGWHPDAPNSDRNKFSHNAYLNRLHNARVAGNVFAEASNFGVKLTSSRPGGFQDTVVADNLFIGNTNGLTFGSNSYDVYTHENIRIQRNVFTRMGGELRGRSQAYGVHVSSPTDEGLIEDNIFINTDQGGSTFAVKVDRDDQQGDVTIRNNTVQGWVGGTIEQAGGSIRVEDNVIEMDAEPTYTIETYHESIDGEPSRDAFYDEMQQQSKQNWREGYTGEAALHHFLEMTQ